MCLCSSIKRISNSNLSYKNLIHKYFLMAVIKVRILREVALHSMMDKSIRTFTLILQAKRLSLR
jgi:hypothetical protein